MPTYWLWEVAPPDLLRQNHGGECPELTVIIIEREVFPPPAPGESAHPGIEPLLRHLGVEAEVLAAEFLRHPRYVVRSRTSERYVPFGDDESGSWLGFQLWRPDFDTILLTRAKAAGASVIQPAKAAGLVFCRRDRISAFRQSYHVRRRNCWRGWREM